MKDRVIRHLFGLWIQRLRVAWTRWHMRQPPSAFRNKFVTLNMATALQKAGNAKDRLRRDAFYHLKVNRARKAWVLLYWILYSGSRNPENMLHIWRLMLHYDKTVSKKTL
jgi:hypothetical protein